MAFKSELHNHFKKFSASPFLFIGSGISRRYLGAENWEELLKRFSSLIDENYVKVKSQANGDLTRVASILAKSYSDLWWDSEIKKDKDVIYESDLQKLDSPLKVEISDYLKTVHENVNEDYFKEIELLKNSKIDGIITTNWDLFLESLFNEFSVFIGQDGLFSSRNHGIAEIYKIHGCANEPNSLILTEEDYAEFRKKNPYLSSKLLTIFIEHPIIFIGYSLTDPHILEILEEIVQCFPESKMDALKENIIFIEWDPSLEEPVLTESIILKTLPVKLIRANSYIQIFEVLSEVRRRIPAHVFRQIKDELYDLVVTNDPKGQLYVRNADDLTESDSFQEFVVGYGAISKIKKSEEISKQGIIGLDRQDIVRDIIFNNGNYDCKAVIENAFPKILKGKANTPIFKYLNEAGLITSDGGVIQDDICDEIKQRTDARVESFRPSGFEEKRALGIPEIQIGIKELYDSSPFSLFLRMAVFVPPEKTDLEELEEILKKHAYDNFSGGERSQFIKIVCVFDLLKYSNRYNT